MVEYLLVSENTVPLIYRSKYNDLADIERLIHREWPIRIYHPDNHVPYQNN